MLFTKFFGNSKSALNLINDEGFKLLIKGIDKTIEIPCIYLIKEELKKIILNMLK